MSFKKFKWIDLLIFSVIAVVFELLNYFMSTNFSNFKLIFLSYTTVLSLIAVYRWGISGIIVSILGNLAACVVSENATAESYIIYLSGAISILIPILIFQYGLKRERIRKMYIFIPYLIITNFIVILTRCIVAGIFDKTNFLNVFVTNLKAEIIMESMSIVIQIIIALIAGRKSSKLIVEMHEYVKEVQDYQKLGGLKEIQSQPNFNFDKPFTEEDQIDNSNILDGGMLTQEELDELDEMYQNSLTEEEKEKLL